MTKEKYDKRKYQLFVFNKNVGEKVILNRKREQKSNEYASNKFLFVVGGLYTIMILLIAL